MPFGVHPAILNVPPRGLPDAPLQHPAVQFRVMLFGCDLMSDEAAIERLKVLGTEEGRLEEGSAVTKALVPFLSEERVGRPIHRPE